MCIRDSKITSEYLDYDEVIKNYDFMMEWLAKVYVNTLNLIHYMHDKYYYEAAEMALIDTDVRRTFATGIAGFSHVVDSLSAIKYAKVKTIRNEDGIVVDYETTGDFPRYGNDDDRADEIENEANEKRLAEEREYDRVRLEVTRFKSDVLNLYRSHVESLSRLPEFQKETPAQEAADAEPAADEAEPAAAAQLQAADVQPEAEPVPAAEEDAEPAASAEDDSKAADSSEDFWAKDESQLKLDPPPADPNAAFQGVNFSE